MEASARLDDVSVVLDDRPVLRGVDLDVRPGLTVVRGANGSGKTTLLRALAGLLPIASGTRTVSGEVLILGHRPQLLRGLSARENLSFFARFRGGDAGGVGDALARWGLAADADRPVERLSAGQRRRAALARIDQERCGLVLLDEPFAELDRDASELLEKALARLGDDGRAVVVATHGHESLDAAAHVRTLDGGTLR
ncbi:MAG: ATP-binding cassette domain-containing protein [Chloroflexi bacterium]|nr:ATP-binding cassette domain-containing protein [Chloroflexota bacterium]